LNADRAPQLKANVMRAIEQFMKRLLLISLFVFIATVSAPHIIAKEWRGITPLHSTQSDVVRLFGGCSDRDGGCKVRVGNEEAYFVFSNGVVVSEYHECARKLPPNTVLLIEVTLINPPTLRALQINRKNFRTFDPSSPPNIGYRGYIDEKQGLIIKTYKGNVLQLDYIASAKDVGLCPSYYEEPETFIQLLIDYCCPSLAVNCPSQSPVDGEPVTLSAQTGDLGRVKYKWQVTAGKIVAGQGTLRITVDTTGAGGRTITATIEMNDGSGHVTMSSCEVPVSVRSKN
jgi:hypothetical protein